MPDYDALKAQFNSEIDSLLDNMGQSVTVVFKPEVTSVPDTTFVDPLRGGADRLPDYKLGSSGTPVSTPKSTTVKAIVVWNPREAVIQQIRTRQNTNVVRLRTLLSDTPTLQRADYIVPNPDTQTQHLGLKFRLVRGPVPNSFTGRYATTWWEQV